MFIMLERAGRYVGRIFGFFIFSDHFSYINYFHLSYGLFYMIFQSFNHFLELFKLLNSNLNSK